MIYKVILTTLLTVMISKSAIADSVVIDKKVSFAKGAEVRQAVKNECELGNKFSSFLKSYLADQGITAVNEDSDEASKISKRLHVEIDRVVGQGGGAWSGGKMVHAVGTLKDNGKVIGSFKVQRTSGGGAFGAFKGTCSILGRDVKAMAKDISVWMKSPSKDAYLGEL